VIESLVLGTAKPLPQVGEGSYARKLLPEEQLIDWSASVTRIHNLVRALSPDPCASTLSRSNRIRILRADPLHADMALPDTAPAGMLMQFARKRAAVHCGDGWLELIELQFPGRTPTSAVDLLHGRRLLPGTIFSQKPVP